MPGQTARQRSVRRKLSTIEDEFAQRCVLLVDDSLVCGTTSREIITMARESKATKVLFASTAPPVSHPHIYGIDLASPADLIAHNRDLHDVAKHIGADELIYQDLQDLVDACAELAPKGPDATKFEVGVFCGKYITEVPPGYLEHLDQVRGKKRKMAVVEEIHVPSETANGGSLKRSSAYAEEGSRSHQASMAGPNGLSQRGLPPSSASTRAPTSHAPADWPDIKYAP
ncbi:hypothetical protein DL764_006779 [Monosporascus ibericus]|uniref:Phosphoribosyltransferase domain-containing protein n=1 Tax=Monosporascus ibericus TaxID=155417 RepID=A0A4Q4T3V0_9PEZI|nr:hypothetical protein DL764_006779 [Monosporascus ibericus]